MRSDPPARDKAGSGGEAQRPATHAAVVLLLVVGILLVDLFYGELSGSWVKVALVDEPAHLATCLLLLVGLAAVARVPPGSSFVAAALVATVAIDLDHSPDLVLDWGGLSEQVARPYPHSLIVPLALVALALIGWRRKVLLGAAFGVAAHMLRDLATGPGVALLWPASAATVRLPYLFYVAALMLAAALAVSGLRERGARSGDPTSPRNGGSKGRRSAQSPRGVVVGSSAQESLSSSRA